MKKYLLLLLLISANLYAFPIPKDNEVSFDIIRKNKNIGSLITTFKKEDDKLQIRTILDIKVKVFLITVYKFFQDTTETWIEGEFVKIEGYTNFEDEREYYIEGNDLDENFIASGMDGELTLSNKILPLNYWNKKILEEEEVFDTQKGIVRKITVQKLENDIIKMNNKKIEAEKYIMNASKNPKDKGPFPQYTLWYKDDELIKFEFVNPKDKKVVTGIRNDLENN
ncbi:MAG: DUF6134 family protein [Alphaproteobacteria bacterium]|nr:DUF6134 family protein [Alphaproteobacteria bacterium]